jgi:transcriptional regulator with XRE-family HTH domain
MTKPFNPVDIHLGSRMRMRRSEMGMSQQALGSQLGLTFQQIQNYEKGASRIGASRLQQIARILKVPAGWFFEGAPGGQAGDASTTRRFLEFFSTRDGRTLIISFSKIRDARLRRSILELVQRLAAADKRSAGRTRK